MSRSDAPSCSPSDQLCHTCGGSGIISSKGKMRNETEDWRRRHEEFESDLTATVKKLSSSSFFASDRLEGFKSHLTALSVNKDRPHLSERLRVASSCFDHLKTTSALDLDEKPGASSPQVLDAVHDLDSLLLRAASLAFELDSKTSEKWKWTEDKAQSFANFAQAWLQKMEAIHRKGVIERCSDPSSLPPAPTFPSTFGLTKKERRAYKEDGSNYYQLSKSQTKANTDATD